MTCGHISGKDTPFVIMSGFTSQDITALRMIRESITQGIILESDKNELKQFLIRNSIFICERLTSTTGIDCWCISDYMYAILTRDEFDHFTKLMVKGKDPEDVSCHIFFFGMTVLLLTDAECVDVLREAGIIIEVQPKTLFGCQVGDNGTHWRRRNLRETV